MRWFGLLVALFGLVGVARADDGVVYADGRLGVTLREAPLRSALERVAARTGVVFLLDPAIQASVTVRFADLPLLQGLRRLLSGFSHGFLYGRDPSGRLIIRQVKVLRSGVAEAGRFERIGPEHFQEPMVAAPVQHSIPPQARPQTPPSGPSPAPGGGSAARIESIDPLAANAPARVMAAIVATRGRIVAIQRQAEGERRALQNEISRVSGELAAGQGDARVLLEQRVTLERQQARSERNAQSQLLVEQANLQRLEATLAQVATPAAQQTSEREMANRGQALVSGDQAAQRSEVTRRARNEADQRAAMRQLEIRRAQERATRSGQP
ncbi:MAG: hypothetical protein HQM03_12980 [Magnetococcales bacterium]|nr:hypothetical protein [Magnetococcales bacterium]